MYLVLLETSGNQRYIFATNKLRENVGASHLTYLAGTQWVLEAVRAVTGQELWSDDVEQLARNLQSKALNPLVEEEGTRVEVITATSGKALLLVQEEEVARSLVAAVTKRALCEAPGLDLCGVVTPVDWAQPLGPQVQLAHRRHQEVHASLPGPELRFPTMPFVAPCDVSGLPASALVQYRDEEGQVVEEERLSKVSLAKRDRRDDGIARMERLLGLRLPHLSEEERERPQMQDPLDRFFARGAHRGGDGWVAIVHADGNGVGGLFHRFWDYAISEEEAARPSQANRTYVGRLREFSLALEACTLAACQRALPAVPLEEAEDGQHYRPLVPLVLGGDDVTVYCAGRSALRFAQCFLTAFEQETAKCPAVSQIAARACLDASRLAASAGVAIVKPHFPFHTAYELAEELCTSAKEVKARVRQGEVSWPCSSLDFHVLYDTMVVNLRDLRERNRPEGLRDTYLHARPFVVTPMAELPESLPEETRAWARRHHWCRLVKRVAALRKDDSQTGARALPSSQLHVLREGLTVSRAVADARFALVKGRLGQAAQHVEEAPGTLFREEDGGYVTGLLDAMEAQEFLFVEKENDDEQ